MTEYANSRTTPWRWTRGGVIALVVLAVLGIAPSAFATGWTAPAAIDAGHLLTSVSCTSTSFCVAGDADGDVLIFNGSSWSTPDPVFSSAGSNPQIASVSCAPGTAFCAIAGAVTPSGASVRGAVATYSDGTWSTPTVYGQIGDIDEYLVGFDSVSCAAAMSCVATAPANEAYITWNGTQWSPQPLPVGATFSDDSYDPRSLACPTSSLCIGLDASAAETFNGSSWSGPTTVAGDGASLFAVSCPSSGFCVATGSDGGAYAYNGSSWSSIGGAGTGLNPWGVSCVSSSFCAVVDQDGEAGYYDGSTWTSSDDPVDGAAALTSVSCTSTTFCVAVDQDGNAIYFSGVPATSSSAGGAGPTGGGSSSTSPSPGTLALLSAAGSRGKLRVSLRCIGAAGASCATAKITATITEHLSGSRITAVTARAGTRMKSVTIAHATAGLAAGQTKTVSLSLDGTGRTLLARFHHLSTAVRVTADGHTIAQHTLRLTAAGKRKR